MGIKTTDEEYGGGSLRTFLARERGEELPEGALDLDEDDLEEALEAAALDELEEDW